MGKKKGSRAERELAKMFWENGFAVMRAAGSGIMNFPLPDLIVGNAEKKIIYAIECKSVKKNVKYLTNEDISQVIKFSKKFGATPLIAIRFNNYGWFFLKPKDLEKSRGESFIITLDFCKRKGIRFFDLI